MKKIFLTLGLLVFAVGQITAQSPNERITKYAGFTGGVGSSKGSLSLSYLHNWRLGAKQKIGVGVGGRFTSLIGANLYYITAPAELTSGSTGPFVIFKENIDENIDSLLVKSPQVNSLNVMVNIDYKFSSRLIAGFNIDVIGFSFGGNKKANFISGQTGKITEGSPTPFNILLTSDNDRGSLNSEFYVKYDLNERWTGQVAAQFLFTEYTTDTKVQEFPEENDRFRNKALLFGVGIFYKL